MNFHLNLSDHTLDYIISVFIHTCVCVLVSFMLLVFEWDVNLEFVIRNGMGWKTIIVRSLSVFLICAVKANIRRNHLSITVFNDNDGLVNDV